MITIIFGKCPGVIYKTSRYFDGVFKEEWLDDPFVKDMIKDVDKSEVLGNRVIKSPVLGLISPRDLSGGVKTLILIHKIKDKIFNASQCGDNCANNLIKISEKENIKIWLFHTLKFFKCVPENAENKIHLEILYDNMTKKVKIDKYIDYINFVTVNSNEIMEFYE